MDTLYFMGFCFLITLAIVWGYVNDDYAEFNDADKSRKFSVKKKVAESEADNEADEKDTPQANLL